MALIVQKYGGSSVADVAKIQSVARRIADSAPGHHVVVVVSAMGKTTDGLVSLAHQLAPAPDPREMDMLLATGEQVTIALLAMALQALGFKARSFTGAQAGLRTDRAHTKARIARITADRVRAALDAGAIAVVAGFQGATDEDEITTLGRGGSDLTAVALAAALKAELCEIYTDVDGVYTADPAIVPDAKKLARVSYDEMLEMAASGAKVLMLRCVEYARRYGVPVVVRSSFSDRSGTWVVAVPEEEQVEQAIISGVAHDLSEARVTVVGVPDKPGEAAGIFRAIADAGVNIDMIVQNVSGATDRTDISFTLPKSDLTTALTALAKQQASVGFESLLSDEHIGKVSLVGAGMRSH